MKLTENRVEGFTVNILKSLGYEYAYGPDIAPGSDRPERQSYRDVVLVERFHRAIDNLNPHIPEEARDQVKREVLHIAAPQLIDGNETFHTYLCEGVDVEFQEDGITRGDKVWLVDFHQPKNNDFLVVNQFTVSENNVSKRPDIVLFVNGLPLAVMELKNPTAQQANIQSAYNQLQTYKTLIPSLFTYNALLVIADGSDARAGSLSADYSRFTPWKSVDGKIEDSPLASRLEILCRGMLPKATLLDLIRHFTVFEKSRQEDPVTGLTRVQTEKKIAAYHQYDAVNRAVVCTGKAAADRGSRRAGVVWHTQGSGKSLTMVFYAGKLVLSLDNPTIVVITDRNDLDDQLFDTFAACRQLLRQEPVQADNREDLRRKLRVECGGIVFTTIHKFSPLEGETVYPLLSERQNIVVIADEAHRSQYGFRAREVDVVDEQGNIVGKRTAYGFAKYVRDALPNATFVGFTGTPVESTDRSTPAVFGDYIDIYDIARAVEDEFTVPIYYESRFAKVRLDDEGRRLIEELDEELDQEDMSLTQQAKARWTRLEAIVGTPNRLRNVARDLVDHFETRRQAVEGKAMVVTMSRRLAAAVYGQIVAMRPAWHHRDLNKGAVKVVMTGAADDVPELAVHHTTKVQRRRIADRFKDPADPLIMVIVCDMWLTGFNAPSLHTMYIDKPMRGHNLMQAIARVNRVYLDKPGGLVVDYIGFAADLKRALLFYSRSGGKGTPANMQEDAVQMMMEKLEVVRRFFNGFDYRRYFSAGVGEKLAILLQAQEHILQQPEGKSRFIREVQLLSRAFALSVPHEAALAVKEEVAFFQAVKARLHSFDTGAGKSAQEIDSAIRRVVGLAVGADRIVDIFAAAGMEKPDISILSEEFLEEVKDLPHKHLAVELLKRLLKDEIKGRIRQNIIQGRKLMEMLEEAIRRYQANMITAAQVITVLIELARDIKEADARGEKLGLSETELAFYDALADNRSALQVLGQPKLREMAVLLVQRVKAHAAIDWNIKESVRSRMKVTVKRLLRRYGYPPDKQALATDTVLQQAQLFTAEWVQQTLSTPS
jgi:type I restriction enzyme R subunit